MAEYDISDVFEDVILKLGDHRFKLRERTRSLGEKIDPLEDKLPSLEDDQDAAGVLIELIDMLLEPQGDGNGTRSHAKTILSRSYKNDEIGIDRLMAIADFLGDKFTNRRPTSAATPDG